MTAYIILPSILAVFGTAICVIATEMFNSLIINIFGLLAIILGLFLLINSINEDEGK